MFTDYHVHSDFSEDCKCPMEDMVLRGIEMNMDEIAFTEHVDYGMEHAGVVCCDYPSYFAEFDRLKAKYSPQICLKRGIEFGVQTHTIAQCEAAQKIYPFDFVILSNHQVNGKEFWNQDFQKGKSQPEIHDAYYNEIYQVVQNYKNYSVLGHLDMIKRYDPYGDYPDENIMDWAEKILRQVIADGKGIEVNTSCFRYGLKDLTPSRAILKLYQQLGGTILTLGSDAHTPEQLGARFCEEIGRAFV